MKTIYLGMGCFWGAEKLFWQLPGVVATAVGYQGGGAEPTDYRTVCTGKTGHSEVVRVDYDESVLSTRDVLRVFWENHDPTQGNRQGNDIGTQYRSTIFWTDDEQRLAAEQTRDLFEPVLIAGGMGPITTEISAAERYPFHLAEEHHQKYLKKNPNGYDCHGHIGFFLPR